MKLKLFYRAGLLIAFFLLLTAGQSRADLPPDAQAAMKKGIMAAKEQEWEIAIQSFQDARKIAPDAPEIYYNLGLAESKIPGRELRAIAWFGAYLAAMPKASNAAAVEDVITGLQIKSEGNLNRLIKSVQDAANQLPEESFDKENDCRVAGLWAQSGDMTAANKIISLFEDYKDKELGYMNIAEGQAQAGDIEGAQKTADLIENGNFKSEAQGAIAVEQIKAGDTAGAQETFKSAREAVDHVDRQDNRESGLEELAKTQAKVGDITGAQKSAALIQNDSYEYAFAQESIVTAQITAGDMVGAQKTIDLMPDGNQKKSAQIRSTFPKVPQDFIQPAISDWLKRFDDASQYTYESDLTDEQIAEDCPLNTDPFLDLSRYLTSQHSNDPKELFEKLYDTAKKIIKAQNIIDRMIKLQAKEQAKP